MIIFDLDGTLADCSHRRHFVDPNKNLYMKHGIPGGPKPGINILIDYDERTGKRWKPDYQSFNEACSDDTPIEPVISIWNDQISLGAMGSHMIWSGRSESVREKTEKWLEKHLLCFESHQLKMRPIGNTEPDEVLKERWLDGYLDSMYPRLEITTKDGEVFHRKSPIEFVFDSHYESIKMWRRRGIFVFNCCQHDEEF